MFYWAFEFPYFLFFILDGHFWKMSWQTSGFPNPFHTFSKFHNETGTTETESRIICKGQIKKHVELWNLSSFPACSAHCIPASRGSIQRSSVKVVNNSYHHKRREQTEKKKKNNQCWHSRDIPPKSIASVWKNVIACAQPCSEKYTSSLSRRA